MPVQLLGGHSIELNLAEWSEIAHYLSTDDSTSLEVKVLRHNDGRRLLVATVQRPGQMQRSYGDLIDDPDADLEYVLLNVAGRSGLPVLCVHECLSQLNGHRSSKT